MKIFLILSFINLNAFGALSYGDASDGDCTWNVTQTLAKNIWNCNNITIGGAATIDFAGSSVVELRAQGTVTILGTIDISASGTTAGPGGGTGGTCTAASFCSGEDGIGSTGGEGTGGQNGGGGGLVAAGGGGGGGSYGTVSGVTPTAGTDIGGGTAGTAGSNGTTWGPSTNFPTSISGGRGGGAGGSSDNSSSFSSGGNGGAGAGAIVIVAKDNIDISGQILAVGGNGSAGGAENTFGGGGGGGAGSGGAVYIVSNSSLTVSGTIDTSGGTGGVGPNPGDNGGDGGDGGEGRVRLDDSTGSPDTTGSTLPGGTSTSTSPSNILDPLAVSDVGLTSDIEYACTYKEQTPLNFLIPFFLGLILINLGKLVLRAR